MLEILFQRRTIHPTIQLKIKPEHFDPSMIINYRGTRVKPDLLTTKICWKKKFGIKVYFYLNEISKPAFHPFYPLFWHLGLPNSAITLTISGSSGYLISLKNVCRTKQNLRESKPSAQGYLEGEILKKYFFLKKVKLRK